MKLRSAALKRHNANNVVVVEKLSFAKARTWPLVWKVESNFDRNAFGELLGLRLLVVVNNSAWDLFSRLQLRESFLATAFLATACWYVDTILFVGWN